jgi:hypothetical protein
MKTAHSLLEKFNKKPNVKIDDLIHFYESRKLNVYKKMKLKYSEIVAIFLNNPTVTLEDMYKDRGLSATVPTSEDDNDRKKKGKKKGKKDKEKSKSKKKDKVESPVEAPIGKKEVHKESVKESVKVIVKESIQENVKYSVQDSVKPTKTIVKSQSIPKKPSTQVSDPSSIDQYYPQREARVSVIKHTSPVEASKKVNIITSSQHEHPNTPVYSNNYKSSDQTNSLFQSQTINEISHEPTTNYSSNGTNLFYTENNSRSVMSKTPNGKNRGKLLPNNPETWRYYQKRNGLYF